MTKRNKPNSHDSSSSRDCRNPQKHAVRGQNSTAPTLTGLSREQTQRTCRVYVPAFSGPPPGPRETPTAPNPPKYSPPLRTQSTNTKKQLNITCLLKEVHSQNHLGSILAKKHWTWALNNLYYATLVYRKHRGMRKMLNRALRVQSAKSTLPETLGNRRPSFSVNKLQGKKTDKDRRPRDVTKLKRPVTIAMEPD